MRRGGDMDAQGRVWPQTCKRAHSDAKRGGGERGGEGVLLVTIQFRSARYLISIRTYNVGFAFYALNKGEQGQIVKLLT
jgi:hypothetical protein